jgi:pimeloyl-ACP methyl ester carboxylesterase
VVLLHGLASSFEHNWREPGWVDLLTESGREVVPLDLPAHGKGPHATDPSAYADVPGMVAARLPPYVDAVGFSLGGLTLLALAAREPERFRRLAVLGVGDPGRSGPPSSRDLGEVFDGTVQPEGGPAQLFLRLAEAAGNDRAALAAFVRREPPPAPDLSAIAAPVLVVVGEKDFVGPADGLVAALPNARKVVLRGTDHFATTSDYRCIDAVLTFLEE